MAAPLEVPVGHEDSWWWWELQLPKDRNLLARIARVLVRNGADPYHITERTSYYLRYSAYTIGHEIRLDVPWSQELPGLELEMAQPRVEYDPTLGRVVWHQHARPGLDHESQPTFEIYNKVYGELGWQDSEWDEMWACKYYSIWTMLHTAMVYGTRHSVAEILSCGVVDILN